VGQPDPPPTHAGPDTFTFKASDAKADSNIATVAITVAQPPLTPPPPPTKCKVPKVVGKTLAAAELAIKKGHCRTGRVSYARSPKVKKGIVISQSHRPGAVLPRNAKINLVVSRGRRP
jgi:hypothetical protein